MMNSFIVVAKCCDYYKESFLCLVRQIHCNLTSITCFISDIYFMLCHAYSILLSFSFSRAFVIDFLKDKDHLMLFLYKAVSIFFVRHLQFICELYSLKQLNYILIIALIIKCVTLSFILPSTIT